MYAVTDDGPREAVSGYGNPDNVPPSGERCSPGSTPVGRNKDSVLGSAKALRLVPERKLSRCSLTHRHAAGRTCREDHGQADCRKPPHESRLYALPSRFPGARQKTISGGSTVVESSARESS
jgi:hypothetical protein